MRWPGSDWVTRKAGSALDAVKRARAVMGTGRVRTLMLVLSAVLFAVILVISIAQFPSVPGGLSWAPIAVVALVGYPAMVVCMSGQYQQAARFVGKRVGARDAATVAVLSAAANLLPIPGALLMRTEALVQQGVRYKTAIAASTVTSVAWLLATSFFVTVAVVGRDPGLAVAAGVAGCVAAIGLARMSISLSRTSGISSLRIWIEAFLLGSAVALVAGTIQWLILEALRVDVSWADALVISASSVLAAIVGFFPGGLGLREAFGAGLAATVGIPASVGVVAVSLTRVVGMSVLLVITGFIAVAGKRRTRPDHSDELEPTPDGSPGAMGVADHHKYSVRSHNGDRT